MKNLLYTVLFLLTTSSVFAQTSTEYIYSTGTDASLVLDANGNTVSMSSGTTQLVGQNSDNGASAATSIGFTFTFMGTTYTQFSASANGAIRLGGTAISGTMYGGNFPVASTAIIAPYLQNLKMSNSGKVHYKLHGTYPERILVVEFLNFSIDNSGNNPDNTMQLRLYEGSNIIEFVYGTMKVGSVSGTAANRIAAIGFSNNTGAGNQLSIDQATLASNTSASATYNTNSSTGNITTLNSTSNGSRRYIRFTPDIDYKSKFISMNTGSSQWCAGESRQVSVTVVNIGNQTWTDAGTDVNIGVKWNADADYLVRTDAGNLAPGDTATYTFTITAPATTGANNITFDVAKEGDCWFANNNGSCGPGNLTYATAVTINAYPTATISYGAASYCTSTASATVTRTGTTGGTYSASPTGLTINSSTGTITPSSSTAGTYTVTYSFSSSGCSNTATTTVTIVKAKVATFSYTGTPYCQNATNPLPTFSGGGEAGTFSSTAGLVFVNTSTGEINLSASTAGTYTVTNTIAASSPCAQIQATSSVTIVAVPLTSFSYAYSSYCSGSSNPSPVYSGGATAGTFSASPSGLSIAAATGIINVGASSPGTYTVTNTKTVTGCGTYSSSTTVTITTPFTVSITTNYCVVPNKVRLTADVTPAGSYTYLWSSGETTSTIDADVVGSFSVTVSSGGCTVSASTAVGIELVTNGSFSSGNTGFTTGYTYTTASNGLYPEGYYAVGTNATFYHNNFFGTDHTSNGAGTGNFMIVNGSPLAVQPVVWQQTVTGLTPGATYYFSAWATSMNTAGNYAMLRFAVNGTQLGSTATLAAGTSSALPAGTAYNWVRFYGTYVATSTSAVLSVVDLQTAAGGNDFGLDDISFANLGLPGYTASPTVSGGSSTVCEGSALSLTTTVSGGASPYSYSWTGPESFTSSQQNPSVSSAATLTMGGTYYLTVTDNNGCSTNALVDVTVPARPSAPSSVTASPSSLCLGGSSNLNATSSGNTINWYTASSGGTLIGNLNSGVNQGVTPSSAGTTTYYAEAQTSYGCLSTSRTSVSVTAYSLPVAGTLSATPAVGSICIGSNVSATFTAGSGGTGTVTDVLQYRFDGGAWTTYTSGTNLSTTGHTSVDIRTYRTATGTGCTTSSTNTVSWTIVAQPVAGTLSPSTPAGSICVGSNVSASLTAGTGGSGAVTDVLEYRFDGGSWGTYTSGNNLSTTGHTSVDIRTYRTATGTNCSTSSTNTLSWTIVAQPVAGTLSPTPAAGSVCIGSNVSAALTAGSGGSGTVADVLQYRFDGGAWTTYTSGTNLTTTGHTSIDIRTYRTATGSNCTTSSTNTVSWTIVAQPVSGSLTPSPASGTLCAGSNVSATATAGTGGAGTTTDVLEYRFDGGSWTTYTSGSNLSTSGHTSVDIRTYRTATGSNCTTSSTNTVSWTIVTQPTAGTLSPTPAAGSICIGSNVSAAFTAGSGGTGTVADVLQYRFDGGAWTTYTSGSNLATTGHTSVDIRTYRTATGTNCSTSSTNTVSWTIVAQPVTGTLTPSPATGTICIGGNVSATLTAGSGGAGTVTDVLQYRFDGGSWTNYTSGNNLATTGHTSVDIRTYRTATGSNCTTSSTSTVSWTIVAQPVAGTLTPSPAAGSICIGSNVSATLAAGSGGSGTTADVLQYRFDGGSWTTYTSGTNLATTGHTSVDIRTYRTATGTNCSTSSTNTVSWTISAQAIAGTLTPSPAAGTICVGSNVSAAFTAGSGGAGTVADVLQYRIDGGAWTTYTSGSNLATTGHTSVDIRTFRTATGSNCTTSSTNTVSWTIVAQPVAGTLTPSPATGTICIGSNVSATLAAGSGGSGTTADVLEYRFDGGAWTTYTSGTNLATTGHTSIDIRTYRTATGSNCTSSSTNTVSWIIAAQPVAGLLTPSIAQGAICSGTDVSATLAAGSGGSGTVTDVLQYRFDGGSWTTYTSGANLSTSGHTSVDIRTYRTATGTNCSTSSVNTVSWTITASSSATISYPGSPFCSGSGTANVTLTGTTGGTFSASPSGLTINSTTGQVDLSASSYGSYTVTYSIAANGPCPSFSTTASIVVNTYTWAGTVNTDWHNPANWVANIVPDLTCDLVYIPNTANKPILGSGTATIRNLTVASGGLLTIQNATLQIAGVITSTSAINAGQGAIELIGTSSQTVGGTMFVNKKLSTLVNSNSVGVDISNTDSLLITSAVLFGNVSSSVITTNNRLTLLSRDTSTARVGIIANGNSISGNVTVERYIPNHTKAWQFLAVPTKGQSVKNAWQEGAGTPNGNPNPGYGTMITGSMSGATAFGFDVATPGNGSMKTYDENTANWIGIPNTTNPIYNQGGYMTFIRGDRSVTTYNAAPTALVLRSTGTLMQPNDAPQVVNVLAGKYASVANPYASAIDFSKIGRTGGVANMFYVWDPKLSGDYGYGGWQTFTSNSPASGYTITPGGGSYGGGNTNIESGMAILVYAPSTAGSITFDESAKVSGSNLITRQGGLTDQVKLNLHVIRNGQPVLLDGVLTQFDASYSNNIDVDDAPKVNPTSETISILSADRSLSVERRGTIVTDDTIQYRFGLIRQQAYELEVIAQDMNDPGLTAFMEDRYLHTLQPVDLNSSTRIPFTVTTDPASASPTRFRLVFRQASVLPVSIVSINARKTAKHIAEVNWKVENEINISNYTLEKSVNGITFTSLKTQDAKGISNYAEVDNNATENTIYYRVKATSADGRKQYSAIAKVSSETPQNDISIYPNPVTNSKMNITFGMAGKYNVQLTGLNGQKLFSVNVTASAGEITTITLPSYITAGMYNVHLVDAADNHFNIPVQIR